MREDGLMTPHPIEVDFAEFQRTGDPERLGAVFDAVAPKLLLVAGHLTPEPHDAEDLVQSTFVEVLRHRDRWSRDRRLFPWFCGILANVARRRRRRTARDRDPARPVEPDVTEDPAVVVESKEGYERLVAEIDRLEPRYRQVLTLRVLRGLSHAEIAHLLGESPETVRTRVHRGLARIRGSLPSSLAAALVAVTGGRGLAAVREEVLAEAGGVGATAVGASSVMKVWMGVTVMRRSLIVAAVLLGVAFVAMRWESPVSHRASMAGAVAAPVEPVTQPERASVISGSESVATRTEVPVIDAEKAGAVDLATTRDPWRVFGRVTDRQGAPVAGVRVWAHVPEIVGLLGEVTTSGEDGSYSITLEALRELGPAQRVVCSVEVRAERKRDGVHGRASFDDLPRDDAAALEVSLDLRMSSAGGVVGRVVDSLGRPVVGADLNVMRAPRRVGESIVSTDGTSASDGEFVVDSLLCDQTGREIVATHPEHGRAAVEFEHPEDVSVVDVGELVLRPLEGTSIARLVLRDGSPASGVHVRARTEAGDLVGVRCTEDGSVLAPTRDGEPLVELEVDGLLMPNQRFTLGERDTFVVDGTLLTLRATDIEGRILPKVSFEYRAWGPDDVPHDLDDAAAAGRAPTGQSSLNGVRDGRAERTFLFANGAAMFVLVGHDALGRKARAIRLGDEARRTEVFSFEPLAARGRIVVHAVDDTGADCASHEVSLSSPTGLMPSRAVRGDGAFSEIEVTPGVHRLTVNSGEHTPWGRSKRGVPDHHPGRGRRDRRGPRGDAARRLPQGVAVGGPGWSGRRSGASASPTRWKRARGLLRTGGRSVGSPHRLPRRGRRSSSRPPGCPAGQLSGRVEPPRHARPRAQRRRPRGRGGDGHPCRSPVTQRRAA